MRAKNIEKGNTSQVQNPQLHKVVVTRKHISRPCEMVFLGVDIMLAQFMEVCTNIPVPLFNLSLALSVISNQFVIRGHS